MRNKAHIIFLAIAIQLLSLACLVGSAYANPVPWPPMYSNRDIAYLFGIFAILEFHYFLLALLAFKRVSWVKSRIDTTSFVFISLAMTFLVMIPLAYYLYPAFNFFFHPSRFLPSWLLLPLGVLSLVALFANWIYRWHLKRKPRAKIFLRAVCLPRNQTLNLIAERRCKLG